MRGYTSTLRTNANTRYVIGADFGIESGRANLFDISNGKELATTVYQYSNGVIDEKLPGTSIRLERDWALQDSQDYIRTQAGGRIGSGCCREPKREYFWLGMVCAAIL